MKSKIFLILAGPLLAYVTHAADSAIILKAKGGQTVEIKPALAQQSDLLHDMLNAPEFMELHNQKDEDGNCVLEFKEVEVALPKLPALLKFAQKYPIKFPEKPTLQERKTYQDDITKIVAEFKKFKELYFGKMPYTEIFKIAQFFDIPVIKQTLGQLRLSPALDLKALEQHAYVSSSSKLPINSEFQDWVALQLERRKDLDKKRYFAGEIEPNEEIPYFKGVSIQDYIDHGKTENLLSRRHGNMLWLYNMALCSLEGLEKLLELVGHPIKILDLSNNRLTTIPSDVPGCEMVKVLLLNKNKINVFPNKISGWSNLQEIELSGNKIEVIPEEIVGLENIRSLILSCNEIKEIPTSIKGLNSLTAFFAIGKNKITSIPMDLHGLERLRSLDLTENQIKEIPSNINGLDSLINLSLEFNKITDVPEDIPGLPSLQHLRLWGNPVLSAPHDAVTVKRKLRSLQESVSKRQKKEVAFSNVFDAQFCS